jgi:DNA-binding XRE family transcriptional regulator
MKLEEWLISKGIEFKQFAKKINASRATVWHWRTGKFKPNKFFQKIINKETSGDVSQKDWEE